MSVDNRVLSLVFVTGVFVLIIAFCALFFGLFGLGLRLLLDSKLLKHPRFDWLLIFALPSAWTLLEYARAWGYGLFWSGPGSLGGPHWSFAHLGYVFHDQSALRMLASVGGVYLLSFLIVLFSVAVWRASLYKRHVDGRKFWIFALALAVACFALGSYLANEGKAGEDFALAQSASSSAKVLLVTTDFPAAYSQNVKSLEATAVHNAEQLQRLDQALALGPDVVIFPEGSEVSSALLAKFENLPAVTKYFMQATGDRPIVLLDNILSRPEARSRLLYVDSKDGLLDYYDKRMIFPGGEYIPHFVRGLASVFGGHDLLKRVETLRVLSAGEKPDLVVPTRHGKIGGLICSGIISTELPANMTRAGAQMIVVTSSNALFRSNKVILEGNVAMSQLRAVESGRYLLLSTNGGYSFAINSVGTVIRRQYASDSPGNVSVVLLNHKTLYIRFGNWVVLLSAAILLATVGLVQKVNQKESPHP